MAEMYDLPKETYTMQRGIKFKGEMQYDITLIPPIVINGHFNKTKGHIHSTGHKEWYTVLEGSAIFLLQNDKDCYFVHAKKGDEVEIPGDYYHISINPRTDKPLKLANWVSKKCISEYKYIENKKGMRWYFKLPNIWVQNPAYKDILPLREVVI